MIPLDEVQIHINSLVTNQNTSNELSILSDLWQYLESKREYYAQQPQVLLDHTNDLSQQVNELQAEKEALEKELAILHGFTQTSLNYEAISLF